MYNERRHKIFRYLVVGSVFFAFAFMFWRFATAILLAAMLAFALQDTVAKLEARRFSRRSSSLILMSAIVIFIGFPLIFLILKLVSSFNEYSEIGFKNTKAFTWLMQIIHQAQDALNTLARSFNISLSALSKPTEFLTDHVGTIGGWATAFVTGIPGFIVSVIAFSLALFYFLNESNQIKKTFINWDLLSEPETDQLVMVVKKSARLALVSTLLVAAIQAAIISIFAVFCGFDDFFLVYIFTFIFALIPVVGCAPPALFLILVSFMNDKPGAAIAMVVAFAIASTSDNVIKAMLLKSANDQIHPVISLLALVGAIFAYGPAGILIGPIVMQLAFNVIPIIRDRNGNSPNISSDL
ncbi:MAG: hypothetical protein K0R29_1395 [Pseudobdellovibrio sp.]|jgi:predicted PurR-regulated permease PerM|nr:hypothetical protein [Pseudobdellovibrio sp.]